MNPHHPDTMNTPLPTPRTDAIYPPEIIDREFVEQGQSYGWGTLHDMRECARDLERELAHANEEVAFYSDSCDRNAELLAGAKSENEAMLAAIQEAEEAFLTFNDVGNCKAFHDAKDKALAALKPFLPESPCQPGE